MPRRSRWILAAGSAYALAIAVVGLWPTHVDQDFDAVNWPPVKWILDRLDLTPPHGYDLVEFTANVLWFAPFGLLLRALRPGWSWLTVILTGALVSAAIEILQAVSRPGRSADVRDVVANTLGVALGCLVYAGLHRLRRASGPPEA